MWSKKRQGRKGSLPHEAGKFTIRNANWEFGRPVLGLIFHLASYNATELANEARVNEFLRTLTIEVGVIQ